MSRRLSWPQRLLYHYQAKEDSSIIWWVMGQKQEYQYQEECSCSGDIVAAFLVHYHCKVSCHKQMRNWMNWLSAFDQCTTDITNAEQKWTLLRLLSCAGFPALACVDWTKIHSKESDLLKLVVHLHRLPSVRSWEAPHTPWPWPGSREHAKLMDLQWKHKDLES